MGRIQLPEEFIEYLERRLSLSLRTPRKADLESLAQAVAETSYRLTRKKARAGFVSSPYLQEEHLLKAYLLYFTAANLPKIFHPLSEIARSSFFGSSGPLRLLDLGAGTGAMSLGTAFWLRTHVPVRSLKIVAVDQSGMALTECRNAFRDLFAQAIDIVETDLQNIPCPEGTLFDLILAGNILNELSPQSIEGVKTILRRCLDERGFVILIEPALKETSRTLLEFRDTMVADGWFVYAPCVTHRSCPALHHPDDWCHQVLDWERPPFVEWIDERVGLVKRSLKFSYVVLAKQNTNLTDHVFTRRDFSTQFRVVSDRFDEKGRTRLFVCNDLGRHAVVMNKRETNPSTRPFRELERYDLVQLEGVEKRKNDFRVGSASKILPATRPEDFA